MLRPRLVLLILGLITLSIYLPAGRNGFVLYDDPEYITENPQVRAGLTWRSVQWAFTTSHASNWHPLTWISHMLDCELFGLDPGAHHIVSAAWHTANTLLLFAVLFNLTGAFWPSAWVAAFFALHPLHVQSVAWASERKDLLSTFFGLATIWAYTRWAKGTVPRKRVWWFGAALIAFGCSLMAKPMLVTLPFLLLLLDFWPLRRFATRPAVSDARASPNEFVSVFLEKIPFLVLGLASCFVTYAVQRAEAVIALAPYPLTLRLANAALAYSHYIGKTFWPVNLAVIYPLQQHLSLVSASAAGLALVAASILFWKFRTRKPHLFTGWFWYLGTLVPVIGIVQVGGHSMADRYTYFPLIGVFIAIVFEFQERLRNRELPRTPLLALGVASLCACALLTLWQLGFWRNSETLFARAVTVTGPNAVAEVNLGMAYEQGGDKSKALRHYRTALRINPGLAQAHNNLANLLETGGQTDEALAHYREATRLKPRSAMTHANLGSLLARLGQTEQALRELTEAVRLSPGDPRPHYLLGKAFMRAGRGVEAVAQFRAALQFDPDDVASLVYGARSLALEPAAPAAKEALQWAQRAAALAPDRDVVLDTLAMAYAASGEFPAAVRTQEVLLGLESVKSDPRKLALGSRKLQAYRAGQQWNEPVSQAAD